MLVLKGIAEKKYIYTSHIIAAIYTSVYLYVAEQLRIYKLNSL